MERGHRKARGALLKDFGARVTAVCTAIVLQRMRCISKQYDTILIVPPLKSDRVIT